jgi:hypothetical protein
MSASATVHACSNPLPEVAAATARYEADRTNNRIADIVIASAEWNFTPDKVNDLCAAKSLSLPGWMG